MKREFGNMKMLPMENVPKSVATHSNNYTVIQEIFNVRNIFQLRLTAKIKRMKYLYCTIFMLHQLADTQ